MEIINEFEKEKRGPYAGAVGYFAADGSMDTCIVLRTALVRWHMYVQAGGGAWSPTANRKPNIRDHQQIQGAARRRRAVRFASAANAASNGCP